MKPILLRFADRTRQGPHFHLISVEWARMRFPGYHTHDFAEIFWLTRGVCEHRINGQVQQLSEGTVTLIRPQDAHQLKSWRGRGAFRFRNLALSPACFEQLCGQYAAEARALYPRDGQPLSLRLPRPELEALNSEMRELASGPHSLFAVHRAVMNVWIRFLPRRAAARGAIPEWLSEALLQVEEQEILARGVAGFVAAAGRGHEHVARACRRHLGRTPTQIVNEARMRYAAHALRMTPRSVLEISADCGFENPAQFHRLFRAAFGISPGRYRRE